MALANGDTAEATYAAEVMAMSSRRARGLVRDVLSLATLQATQLELRRVRLDTIVGEVLSTLSQAIKEAGARIDVDVGDFEIRCDTPKTERLLTNIVANAVKYHEAGAPPVVHISADRGADGLVRLVVRDEGIGFPPHLAGEIFTPFRRAHRREDYDGTGIGLAIAKTIADQHGWAITAAGEVKKGARFEIRFAGR